MCRCTVNNCHLCMVIALDLYSPCSREVQGTSDASIEGHSENGSIGERGFVHPHIFYARVFHPFSMYPNFRSRLCV